MAKLDFFTVLEEEMDKHFQYDYAFEWDKKNHALELSFILDVQNQAGISLIDEDGQENSQDIAFEDAILFYETGKSRFVSEDFLATIPFDGKKGLSREFLAYLANFLNDTATQGLDDLMDFLADPEAESFELTWNAAVFEEGKAELVETDSYPYPRY
ncbi:DUF3013 family protein [Streptococcus sp. DD12]|uniref:DUF3013 family protein n=1 Tax=Streptococcus sp. DD12 TaxID=1777880 RepID=UPI0008333EFC|nr:DUF3013 family protein [Streptococcus sp. DD12]